MIDIASTISIVSKANYKLLGLAVFSQLLSLLVNSLKVVKVFSILNLKLPIVIAYFMGLIEIFYWLFLPGNIGGDVAKGVKVFPLFNNKTDIFLSIFVDRIIGLIGLLAAFLSTYFVSGQTKSLAVGRTLILISITLLVSLVSFLLFGYRIRDLVIYFNKTGIIPNKYFCKLISHSGWNHLMVIRKNYMALFKATVISIMCYYLGYLTSLIICFSLGIELPFFPIAWIVSLSTIIVLLPISISGLGVREGVTIYFMSMYGITPEKSLAFSAMGFAIIAFIGLIGGVINMLDFTKLSARASLKQT